MTTSLKYRKSTSIKVQFPTVPSLKALPSTAELHQKAFEHDVLVMTYPRTSTSWVNLLKTGTPLTFTWNQHGMTTTWAGYVSHVTKDNSNQKLKEMKVYCIGASYVLKTRSTRTFKNKTVTEVAKTIAKDFGLKFVGEPSSRKFDQLSMTGESYWAFLQSLAKRIGYGFFMQNATMYMRPLDKLLNANTNTAPVFTFTDVVSPGHREVLDRTIDSFKILKGDYIEQDEFLNTHKVTAGVDPMTGTTISSIGTPSRNGKAMRKTPASTLFTDYSTEVVHSKFLGSQAAKDLAQGSRMAIPARLFGQGDPRVSPYKVVFIEGTGPTSDGFWLVKEVVHKFGISGDYQTELHVVTDGVGSGPATAFRRAKGSRISTINLEEKIVRDLASKGQKDSGFKLTKRAPTLSAGQQGFLQLGTFWVGK